MKKIYTSIFLIISVFSFAQNKFEKGYYLDDSGTRIDCFIKNYDWKYNPTSIEVKKTLEGNSNEVSISNLKEFAIDGISKYIRQTVEIDNSKGDPAYSYTKDPSFVSSTVLLRVLVEGKNSLYFYENDQFPERFFFKTENQEIKQLIYKKYFESGENGNSTDLYLNDNFKKQLFATVKCDNSNSKIDRLEYKNDALIDYFNLVNLCLGDTSSKEISKRSKTDFNYKIVAGLNYSHFNLKLGDGIQGVPFDGTNTTEKKMIFGVGFEIEAVMPFNNKNWSIFLQPTYYTNYSGSGTMTSTYYINPNYTTSYTNDNYTTTVKYQYFQIPIGLKRNVYINKAAKLYLNASFNVNISKNSTMSIVRSDNYSIFQSSINGTSSNLAFGVGYEFKDMTIEIRQFTNSNLNPYSNSSSNSFAFQSTGLVLKYKIY